MHSTRRGRKERTKTHMASRPAGSRPASGRLSHVTWKSLGYGEHDGRLGLGLVERGSPGTMYESMNLINGHSQTCHMFLLGLVERCGGPNIDSHAGGAASDALMQHWFSWWSFSRPGRCLGELDTHLRSATFNVSS